MCLDILFVVYVTSYYRHDSFQTDDGYFDGRFELSKHMEK
jgi:hypothetical protein